MIFPAAIILTSFFKSYALNVSTAYANPSLNGMPSEFVNSTGASHPFEFRVSNGGAEYTAGISGSKTGTQVLEVPMDAPSTLYYQCTIHSAMGNTINIVS